MENSKDPKVREKIVWKGYDSSILSLMNEGNTASDPEGNSCPTALDAWSRYVLGWVTPTVADEDGIYSISSQESENGYGIIYIPTERADEYYLLENRRSEGIDAGLWTYNSTKNAHQVSSNGIVLWHIDNAAYYNDKYNINNPEHRPSVMPLFSEYRTDTDDTIRYSLSFNGTVPDKGAPFYSCKNFETIFEDAPDYENGLFLPMYGEEKNANDPDKRVLSDINIRFIEDDSRDMKVEISGVSSFGHDEKTDPQDKDESEESVTEKGRSLYGFLTESELAVLNDPAATAVSKNEIMKRIDMVIEARVKQTKTVSLDSVMMTGADGADKEYMVKITMSKALRFDGRKHLFGTNKKSSKSNIPDVNVTVYYCEKDGSGDWKEAKVKKANIKNSKNATFDHLGMSRKNKKGLGGSAHLAGLVLEDKELNKTLGKTLNKELKALSKKLMADKSSDFTDAQADRTDITLERRLIIPVYPLFVGESGSYTDGNGKDNKYEVSGGEFDGIKKLKDAKLAISYDGGFNKDIKFKFSANKEKDLIIPAGTSGKMLEAKGNYFGYLEYK